MSNISGLLTQKPDSPAPEQGEKFCGGCGTTKPLADFHRHRGNPDGRQSQCRACHSERRCADPQRHREYVRQYRLRHPEKVAANQRRWRDENPDWISRWREENGEKVRAYRRASEARRRALFLNVYSPSGDERMFALSEIPCAYCGTSKETCADHVIALTRGGSHVAENLVAACRSCNSAKGNRSLFSLRRRPTDLQLFATHQSAASAATWTLLKEVSCV